MMKYPAIRRDETCIEELHDIKVADPYRWLEDPDSSETKSFIDAQNAVTVPYLENCEYRETIKSRLTEFWNYPKYSCPFKRGNRYFFHLNTGLQNQSVLYIQDSLHGEPREFLNPNLLSKDGTIAISGSAFSEDGELYAYGLSTCGSDWITVHFKKVSNGEQFLEKLEKVKFSSLAWTHNNEGIFYACYPIQEGKADGTETLSNENQKLYYHKVGTPQSEDILVLEFPEHPKWRIGCEVSDCGKYLIVAPREGCRDNLLYFATLPDKITCKLDFTCIVDKFESDYEYITNDDSVCLIQTNRGAPNYRLIKIDLNDPCEEKWVTLIPDHPKDVISWAACVNNDKLVICYISDVKSVLKLHNLERGEYLKTLPLDIGTVSGYSGRRKHSEMFYQFTSFLSPGVIYHLDFTCESLTSKIFREIKIDGFTSTEFVMKQVFYSSKDGTRIPMFIVHPDNYIHDGTSPTLLYGYGGFNLSLQPFFSVSRVIFMQMFKGVIAIPNIRGGGEYGESWHNGGRLLKKQNCFDDFEAAAEYLITNGYTSSQNLIIQGGSNGGLLIGACITQRPELYGVAIIQAGVMDMIRFHKFTIGYAWISDYGNPDEKEHFENLIKFSPLHNLNPPHLGLQYPATLLLTADHDDRVVPLHSLKFISEMQYAVQRCPSQVKPILIRVDTKAGHGAGKPTAKIIEEITDIYCFVMQALKLKVL